MQTRLKALHDSLPRLNVGELRSPGSSTLFSVPALPDVVEKVLGVGKIMGGVAIIAILLADKNAGLVGELLATFLVNAGQFTATPEQRNSFRSQSPDLWIRRFRSRAGSLRQRLLMAT